MFTITIKNVTNATTVKTYIKITTNLYIIYIRKNSYKSLPKDSFIAINGN